MAETVLKPAEAARYLQVGVSALGNWRKSNTGPDFVRIGNGHGRIRYLQSSLDAWLASRSVPTEGDQ